LGACVRRSEGNVWLAHGVTTDEDVAAEYGCHEVGTVVEERRRVNAPRAVRGGSSLLEADLEVEVVVAGAIPAAGVARFADALASVLEAGVGCAHMAIKNEIIAAVLDNTLGTSGHRVATAGIGRSGDVTRACCGHILTPLEPEIESVVHTASRPVPLSAVVPRELSTAIRLPQRDAPIDVGERNGLSGGAGGGGAASATATGGSGWVGAGYGRGISGRATGSLQPVGGRPTSLSVVGHLEPVIVTITYWPADLGHLISVVKVLLARYTAAEGPSASAERKGVCGDSVALAECRDGRCQKEDKAQHPSSSGSPL